MGLDPRVHRHQPGRTSPECSAALLVGHLLDFAHRHLDGTCILRSVQGGPGAQDGGQGRWGSLDHPTDSTNILLSADTRRPDICAWQEHRALGREDEQLPRLPPRRASGAFRLWLLSGFAHRWEMQGQS